MNAVLKPQATAPYIVADLLGHSDLRTTRIYGRVSDKRLRKALRSR